MKFSFRLVLVVVPGSISNSAIQMTFFDFEDEDDDEDDLCKNRAADT